MVSNHTRDFKMLDLKFQTKIARHEVRLPLYCSHFEIAELKKAFTSHFVFETEMLRYRKKMVRFQTEMIRFRT